MSYPSFLFFYYFILFLPCGACDPSVILQLEEPWKYPWACVWNLADGTTQPWMFLFVVALYAMLILVLMYFCHSKNSFPHTKSTIDNYYLGFSETLYLCPLTTPESMSMLHSEHYYCGLACSNIVILDRERRLKNLLYSEFCIYGDFYNLYPLLFNISRWV